jgi:hypothetical protein
VKSCVFPLRGAPFGPENGVRPPVEVVVARSFEAVLKSDAEGVLWAVTRASSTRIGFAVSLR